MNGTETLTAATASGRPSMPVREDCWSEDASYTLIEAWGERYLELNRGNLRQKHWQEVADAVNNRHGAVKKSRRTDVQCKNRIDTLKKKYKLEKARVLASAGTFISRWPFYNQLDALIGTSVQSKRSHSHHQHHDHQQQQPVPLALSLPYRKTNHSLPHALVVPVAARSVREKRSSPVANHPPPPPVDDSFFRRNYSAIAAAAAADPADSGSSRSSTESRRREGEVDGFKELAQAISRFAEIYERVEGTKQRQMIELEKERMEFMKSLEFQRMQLFMDSQVQLEKIKRAKRASASDIYD